MSLPFYLGSLTDTRTYLHPRDPRLAAVFSLEITPTADGMELQAHVRNRTYRMSSDFLVRLRALAEHSPGLERQFPELQQALRETARAAVKLLKRAAFVPKKQHIFVPQRFVKDGVFLRAGNIVLVAERGDRLIECYELRGANLHHLLREELRAAAGGRKGARVGSLEIFPRDPKHIGNLRIKGQQHLVAPRAFQDYIERLLQTPSLHSRLPLRFTAADCVDGFCEICQQSEEISKGKIARHLEHLNVKANRFRTFERWILAIGEGGCVVRYIEKGAAAHPPHRRR